MGTNCQPERVPKVPTVPTATIGTSTEHVQGLIDALPADMSADQRQATVSFMKSYKRAFFRTSINGEIETAPHRINTGNHPPVRQPLRRHPYALLPEIERNFTELLAAKIIEPAQSCWNSNVLLIRKKDGSMRFCVYYRKLNSLTSKLSYPLPRIDRCLESLVGAQYFSTLNLSCGYWQTEIAEEDRDKTAFTIRPGQCRFTVSGMGFANAPVQFQRLNDLVLLGLNFETCLVFLDDIICFIRTFEEHLTRLAAILDCLIASDLKLPLKKCHLSQEKVDFLRYVVSRDGIAVSPDKVKAVLNWTRPWNVSELQFSRSFKIQQKVYQRLCRHREVAKPTDIRRHAVRLER